MTQDWVHMRKKWENAVKDKINSGFCSLIFLLNSIMSFCQQKDITTTPFWGVNFGQFEVVAILYLLPTYCSINCSDPAEFIYYIWPFDHKRQKAKRGFFNPHSIQVWRYLKEQSERLQEPKIERYLGPLFWSLWKLSFCILLRVKELNSTAYRSCAVVNSLLTDLYLDVKNSRLKASLYVAAVC